MIGKNFTFGVYVEKENVAYGAEIYKVGKIYKERMNCVPDAVTHCQSDKHLEITSGDEVGACKSISIIIVYCRWFYLNTIELMEFDTGFYLLK